MSTQPRASFNFALKSLQSNPLRTRSGSTSGLVNPPLIEIDQLGDGPDVFAICDAGFLFRFLQHRRSEIAPPELRAEAIPDGDVAFVQPSALFETPLQNFFVGAALQDALEQ